jgi:hypothetical protein
MKEMKKSLSVAVAVLLLASMLFEIHLVKVARANFIPPT